MALRGTFNCRLLGSEGERTFPQLLRTNFFAVLDPAFFIAYISDFFFLVFVLGSSGFEREASSSTTIGTVRGTAPGLSLLGPGPLGDSDIMELSERIDGGWDARPSDESSESRRGVDGASILFRKLTDEG